MDIPGRFPGMFLDGPPTRGQGTCSIVLHMPAIVKPKRAKIRMASSPRLNDRERRVLHLDSPPHRNPINSCPSHSADHSRTAHGASSGAWEPGFATLGHCEASADLDGSDIPADPGNPTGLDSPAGRGHTADSCTAAGRLPRVTPGLDD